ncbi:hypothetical protein KSC_100260 [Ktedonobacter sp. SOSP1-52]|nr:hypothetical protein KSC_100260 [Ktedonobacter sp. SOSP1-52]
MRFKSRGRGFSSIENKRNDTSLRFVLQPPEAGNAGFLLWNGDQVPTLIDWKDEVVTHGLKHRIKYARLIQRPTSSPRAAGTDAQGYRYVVQLALEGKPHHKPKHMVGTGTVGGDLGPSALALVPQEGEASLEVFCADLAPDARAIRRLQRQMDRQRRAANPEHYDEKGRIKKQGRKKLRWKQSKRYQVTRRHKATKERKLAAYRKSLHGRKVHQVVALGSTIIIEKNSYFSCARYQGYWEGAQARLMAAHERTAQRAKEGQALPRSFGISRAGARLPESPGEPPLEPAFRLRHARLEAWNEPLEPPPL